MSTLLVHPAAATKVGNRIPTLDGWRGVAILLVLVAHFGPALHHSEALDVGQHGVTIFFVLSGFLITSRLIEERATTGSISLKSFYARRFLRLMPCAWAYLLFVSLINAEAHGKLFTWNELCGSLFFYRNYLDPAGHHLMTAHFWSLSIEEQFYLFWPSILVLGARPARWLAPALAVVIATYRFIHWQHLDQIPIQASLGTGVRADALFIGCAAALWLPVLKPYLRPWLSDPLFLGLGVCLVRYHKLIPLHESLLIALLIVTTSGYPASLLGHVMENRLLAFIGTLSYSIYVWQQLFMIYPTYSVEGKVLKVALAFLVAVASYFFIERPVIRLGRRPG
jgi:peptidoglycan/LPS O-acetylase OafA/YrhL